MTFTWKAVTSGGANNASAPVPSSSSCSYGQPVRLLGGAGQDVHHADHRGNRLCTDRSGRLAYLVALAVLAMGTSEFMLAGLLSDMLAFVLVFAATHAASALTTSFPVLPVAPAVVAL